MNQPTPPMLPQDLEAETALLGSMMLDGGMVSLVLKIIGRDDARWFFRDDHQAIFRAIVAMHDDGKPIDLQLMRDHLCNAGDLERVGGVDYLVHCAESAPTAVNAAHYASIVREKGLLRDLVQAADDASVKASDPSARAATTIERAAKRMQDLAHLAAHGGFRPHLASRCMADIQAEQLQWLWPGRFALGKVNLIAGPPNDGKTFVTMDMAARVSAGTPWPDRPDEPNSPGVVLILNGEDDPNDTLRPRLDAAGADCSRIHIVDGLKSTRDQYPDLFGLDKDLGALEAKLIELKPRLLIIDPVSCFLGRTDSHKDSDLRRLIAPLAVLASRFGLCVLLVSHLNKRSDTNAMNRIQGSVALPAAARTAWLLQRDPADDERRLLMHVKCNVAEPAAGIAFRVTDGKVHWSAEPVKQTASEVLGIDATEGRERSKIGEWLKARLANGPVLSSELKDEAENEMGFNWGTVQKVKDRFGVVTERSGFGKDGYWQWRLTDAAPKGGTIDGPIDCSADKSPTSVRQSMPSLDNGGDLRDSEMPSMTGSSRDCSIDCIGGIDGDGDVTAASFDGRSQQ